MKFLQKDVEKPCCFRCSKTTSDLQVATLGFLPVGQNPKLGFHNVLLPCYPCVVEKQNNSEVVKKMTMGPACMVEILTLLYAGCVIVFSISVFSFYR